MADVLELAHPKPRDDAQSALFGWLLDRRHERADLRPPADLPVLRANAELQAMAEVERHLLLADPDAGARLAAAGMTWEALSGWLNGPLDRAAWQAVIPSMGYMALLRNLRNFDEAEVSDDVDETVAAKLADAGQVTRSRQFPFRFVAAYRSAPSLRWGHALERTLEVATGNVPAFAGRTLVLIDTSASISNRAFSRRSTMTPFEAAAVFGVTMAKRGKPVDLHGFRRGVRAPGAAGGVGAGRGGAVHRAHRRGRARHPDDGGAARDLPRAGPGRGRLGHADVPGLAHAGLVGVQRSGDGRVPPHVPVYGFNLGGYAPTVIESGSGNRHELGGLNDATFTMLSLLESRTSAGWPF